jgi:hypothetical protein
VRLGPCVLDFLNAFFCFDLFVDAVFHWIALIAVCWESCLHVWGIDFWASAVACGVTVRLVVIGVGVTFCWVMLEVKENGKSARSSALAAAGLCTWNSGIVIQGNELKNDIVAKSHYSAVEPCCDSSVDCASTPASTEWLSIASPWSPYTDSVADWVMLSCDKACSGPLVVVIIRP